MPFVKGQSGNPSGRPKITLPDGRSLVDVAREHTLDAVGTLVEVMADQEAPHPSRVSAASAILDRGWGKPKQEIEAGERMIDALTEMLSRIDGQTRAVVPTFEIVDANNVQR